MEYSINEDKRIVMTLKQHYPNPFHSSTKISYFLLQSSEVQLNIYSIYGQKVAELVNQKMGTGTHEAIWNTGDFPNGIYIISLKTKSGLKMKKMTLIK